MLEARVWNISYLFIYVSQTLDSTSPQHRSEWWWQHLFYVHITFTHFSDCHAFEIVSAYKGFADFKSPSVSATFASRRQPDGLVTANQPKSVRWVALKERQGVKRRQPDTYLWKFCQIFLWHSSRVRLFGPRLIPVRVRSAHCRGLVGGRINCLGSACMSAI